MYKAEAAYALLATFFAVIKAQLIVSSYPPCAMSCWNDTLAQMNIDPGTTEAATGIKVCGNTVFDINFARCVGDRCGVAELNATAARVDADCQDTDTPLNITEDESIAAGLPYITPSNQTVSNNGTTNSNSSDVSTNPNVPTNPSDSQNGNCNDVSGTNISVQGCDIASRASGNGRPLSNGEIAGIIVAVVTLVVTIPTGWLACKKILQKRQARTDEMMSSRTTSAQSRLTSRQLLGTPRTVSGMSTMTDPPIVTEEHHQMRQTASPHLSSPPPSFLDTTAV